MAEVRGSLYLRRPRQVQAISPLLLSCIIRMPLHLVLQTQLLHRKGGG